MGIIDAMLMRRSTSFGSNTQSTRPSTHSHMEDLDESVNCRLTFETKASRLHARRMSEVDQKPCETTSTGWQDVDMSTTWDTSSLAPAPPEVEDGCKTSADRDVDPQAQLHGS